MNTPEIATGDTVHATKAFEAIDGALAERQVKGDRAVWYTTGTAGERLTRHEAEAWVAEAWRDGCSLIRYIVRGPAGGAIMVDLAAIEPLEHKGDRAEYSEA